MTTTEDRRTLVSGVTANWSDDLEEFHEELTRDHPIEVLTRFVMLSNLDPLPPSATIMDIGCSTGYMLEDLRAAYPSCGVVGFDLILSGLRKARRDLPTVSVAQADACRLPVPDSCADAVVSINLLEHIHDDRAALSEIRRILRPGASAVLVVPAGPRLYDYYDRFLHHERRYGRGELASKARSVGLQVESDFQLGTVVYPAFWLIKKQNRLRFDHLQGVELEEKVRRDYGDTKDSSLFRIACASERWLLDRVGTLPCGIRELITVRRALID
jgi:ubiquinone/menaquinone biosynthesis C-methylase UbiE